VHLLNGSWARPRLIGVTHAESKKKKSDEVPGSGGVREGQKGKVGRQETVEPLGMCNQEIRKGGLPQATIRLGPRGLLEAECERVAQETERTQNFGVGSGAA